MNLSFLLVGLSSLFFALWTAYGLYRRYKGTLPERPHNEKGGLVYVQTFQKRWVFQSALSGFLCCSTHQLDWVQYSILSTIWSSGTRSLYRWNLRNTICKYQKL